MMRGFEPERVERVAYQSESSSFATQESSMSQASAWDAYNECVEIESVLRQEIESLHEMLITVLRADDRAQAADKLADAGGVPTAGPLDSAMQQSLRRLCNLLQHDIRLVADLKHCLDL